MTVYKNHAAMLDDLQAEQDDGTLVFTWNGQPWKILPGGAKFGRKNDFGGFALSCDLMLTCTTDQFGGTLPEAGELIIYAGLAYTIKTVTLPPQGFQLRIEADLNIGEK